MKSILRSMLSGALGATAGLLLGSVNLCAQDSPPDRNSDLDQTRQRLMERRRAELGEQDDSLGATGLRRARPAPSAPENSDADQTLRRLRERRRAELNDQSDSPTPAGRAFRDLGSQGSPLGPGGRDGFRGPPGMQVVRRRCAAVAARMAGLPSAPRAAGSRQPRLAGIPWRP